MEELFGQDESDGYNGFGIDGLNEETEGPGMD